MFIAFYAVSCGTHFKVGSTNDPSLRISSLQTGNPHKLVFIRVIGRQIKSLVYKERQTESAIHEVLSEWKSEGEWFVSTKESIISLDECFDILTYNGWEDITDNYTIRRNWSELNGDAQNILIHYYEKGK